MANDCLFCKIAAGEIPSTKVYEDEHILAFRDINPVAPVHVLVIPKQHLDSIDDFRPEHDELLSKLFAAVPRSLARPAWPRRAIGSSPTWAGTPVSRSSTSTSTCWAVVRSGRWPEELT